MRLQQRHQPGQKNLYPCKEIHVAFHAVLTDGEDSTDDGKNPIRYQDSLKSFAHEIEIAASFAETVAGSGNEKEHE